MSIFDPGDPAVSGDDLIEDMDGAPLPHELQHGGAIWLALWEAVPEEIVTRRRADEVTADLLRALAPVLWPLLPSNDHSENAARS